MNIRVRSVTIPDANGPQMDVELILAHDEDDLSSHSQAGFAQVEQALRDEGHKVMALTLMRKSLDAVGNGALTGDFIIHLAGPLGGALVAWITAKLGRKVRIKIRDFEVEASSGKELDKAIEKAMEIKKRLESEDKPKPK